MSAQEVTPANELGDVGGGRPLDESAGEESGASEWEQNRETSPEDEANEEEEEVEEEVEEGEEENEVEPSGDIRGDIEEALDELDFDGSYYFHKEFSGAPNPVLQVSGFGRLGLPLSQADAVRLRSICTQAPFGKGERTIVDKSVRDTWELNGSEIRFENPGWRKWMGKVMKSVCEGLGVDTAQSKPYCDLYKLLLYEEGSHFLPHQDSERSDGMFATLVIILPSKFTGGAVCLSHGGDSVRIDASSRSLSSTSVLAWYSDVTHAIQPVTSGYRLALAYNIMHAPVTGSTRNSLIPRLPSSHEAIRLLRGAFLAWRNQVFDQNVPMKIVSLLEHKYSQATLKSKGRKLKGIDAYRVSHLERVAKEYGFRLGLANLECHVDGVPQAPGRYDRYYCDPDPDASEEEQAPHEWVMEEVIEQQMSVTGLVDLMGRELLQDVEHGDDTQMIPEELEETVTEGKHDDQHFEDYQGNYGPSLERWYRRAVVVIWPKARDDEFLYGKLYKKQGSKTFSSTLSSSSSTYERRMPERAGNIAGHTRKRRKLTKEDEVEVIDLTSP
ncbi:hypothetical protein FRC01_008052 [Tulasnella sp. 417]|nr:hypothetical protein FRC01_008052 [Tulasnella sp. 417]